MFLQSLFSNSFNFFITKILDGEIKKSKNYFKIKTGRINLMNFSYNISEVLRPFFGKNEILKGEHEVIAFAYVYYEINPQFIIILDESGPRKFLEKNFSHLIKLMIGTVGFVGKCHCEYDIISEKETLSLLQAIKISKFRVSDNIISSVTNQVKECKNGK